MTKLFLIAALMTLSLAALAVDPSTGENGQVDDNLAVEGCTVSVNGGSGAEALGGGSGSGDTQGTQINPQ